MERRLGVESWHEVRGRVASIGTSFSPGGGLVSSLVSCLAWLSHCDYTRHGTTQLKANGI